MTSTHRRAQVLEAVASDLCATKQPEAVSTAGVLMEIATDLRRMTFPAEQGEQANRWRQIAALLPPPDLVKLSDRTKAALFDAIGAVFRGDPA